MINSTIGIVGFFVIFLASVTQGLAGFGFALVSASIMIIFLPPKVVVPIILIQGTLINLIIFKEDLASDTRWYSRCSIWDFLLDSFKG